MKEWNILIKSRVFFSGRGMSAPVKQRRFRTIDHHVIHDISVLLKTSIRLRINHDELTE